MKRTIIPPEECISYELIKSVEASENDIKQGRYKRFDTHEQLMKELQAIWNESDE
jgi:hypothetical protein